MYKTASEIADRVLVKLAEGQPDASNQYQNVMGFDDLDKFKGLRTGLLEAEKTRDDDWDAMMAQQEAAAPRAEHATMSPEQREAYYSARRGGVAQHKRDNPRGWAALRDSLESDLGGNYVDNLGLGTSVPEMQASTAMSDEAGGSPSAPTGEGYLSKEDLMKRLSQQGSGGASQVTRDAISSSPNRYFTSS